MERQELFKEISNIDGKVQKIRVEFGAVENILNTLHYDSDEDITSLYSEHPYIFIFHCFTDIDGEFGFGLSEIYNNHLSQEFIKVENLRRMYLTLYKLLSLEYKNLLSEREKLVELI